MKIKIVGIMACLAFLFFTGCVSMFNGLMFSPPNGEELHADGKTLAVVAGVDNEMNIAVAESMAEALSRNSTFKVMPSKQLAQRISGYPQQIQGPYNSAYTAIDINYAKTDIDKVRAIMKKLRTDYVYVIWTPTGYSRTVADRGTGGVSGTSKIYRSVAQMFEGPDAKVVGQGRFDVAAVKYIPLTTASDEDVKEAVSYTTEIVSKAIAERSGTKR